MSNYPKYLLNSLLAAKGDVTIPPASANEAGEGRFSQESGWGTLNATPLEQGGIAPFRDDFNGAFYLLSQFALWYQQGGLMNYSSAIAYEIGNEVLQNGVKYRCLKANGGSKSVVAPGTDSKVWKNMDANVPAGSVQAFANVTLGGKDGRRPIFWGLTQADDGWVLCDGGEDGLGGNVPNLLNRFIMGTTDVAQAGQTGGNPSVKISIENIPAHTHTVTIDSAGGHTHNRGSMNITGSFGRGRSYIPSVGAFYQQDPSPNTTSNSGTSSDCRRIAFDASRSWTGETSNNGQHQHVAHCSSTGGEGGGEAQDVQTLPPFLKLAYFVKLPE